MPRHDLPLVTRRKALLAAALALGAGLPAVSAAQPNFPTKAVTIVVPYTAGGASDVQARLIGQKLSQVWGQPVVVDNKPGASAAIGMQFVANAAPDGHTLVISDLGTLTIAPSVRKLPYDLDRDLAPLTILTYSPYLLTAHPAAPYNTLKELIAYAKANPGKINYGTSGLGTNPHLAGRLFASQLGLQWADVPSKGGSQTIQDVISGVVDLQFNSVFSTATYVKGGKLKVLATSSPARLPDFPNTAAVTEVIPGFVAGGYQGMFAPARTPPDVVRKINADLVKVLAMPEVREKLVALGAEPMAGTPEAMRKFLREDRDRWARVIKEHNIRVEQ
jgi:tripartite-type tricarboxylate transporter receptor subunit TctC